jgi:pantothenate kinase
LVNIGSGVSILRVLGDREYERVSGSSIGGGTFWGLCSLLTGVTSFEELLELSSQGDNKRVDMLVGDIYGKGRDYGKIGLSTDTIASSFGKAIMKKTGEDIPDFSKADIAKSLLFMICNNIGQIAYLNAVRYDLKRICFAGYFIRDHATTMRSLSYAINYWSKGEVQAMFLKHEGYLGSLGAFLEPNTKEVVSSPTASPNKTVRSTE